MLSKPIPLGIYEKRSPAGSVGWNACSWRSNWALILSKCQLMKPTLARRSGWNREQRLALVAAIADTGIRVPSICLSAHRRFPLGSEDDAVREQGWRSCVKPFSLRRILVFALFN